MRELGFKFGETGRVKGGQSPANLTLHADSLTAKLEGSRQAKPSAACVLPSFMQAGPPASPCLPALFGLLLSLAQCAANQNTRQPALRGLAARRTWLSFRSGFGCPNARSAPRRSTTAKRREDRAWTGLGEQAQQTRRHRPVVAPPHSDDWTPCSTSVSSAHEICLAKAALDATFGYTPPTDWGGEVVGGPSFAHPVCHPKCLRNEVFRKNPASGASIIMSE